MDERRKLLLIGWDAADWRIARPLMAGGWMPHLNRLIAAGASGTLASLQPRVCPMVWTSVVTGKRAHKHGIHGCAEPLPDGSDIRAVSSTSRTCKALWNILTQRGLRTHAINWPASHPAEPINGVCVSNRFATLPGAPGRPWPRLEQVVHPAGLADTLDELRIRPETLDASALLPFVPRARGIDQDTDRRLMTCAMLLARASTIHAAATWCIEHQPWDFAAVRYDGIELFCRQFGDYQPPGRSGISEKDVEIYQHVVTAAYCFHDMMLGRLLDLAGEETTVLLVSDHGYRPDQRPPSGAVDDEVVHRPPGLWAMRGPGVKRGAELHGASVLDVTPTVLRLLGEPVAHDMDGRVWSEAIAVEPSGAADTPIGSWEDVPGEAGLHPPGTAKGDASLGSIQHLLDLGYVEPRDESTAEAVRRTRERNQHNLARALLEAGQPAQAATLLEPVHQRLPGNAAVAQTLFEAYLAMERFRAARELAESALAHGVNPALAHVALAAVELAMRSPTAALEHLETAEQLGAPAASRLQVLVGQGYRRLRRWQEAERAFRRATEMDPDDAEAWHGLATVALAHNRDDGAAEFALRALELRPDYPEAHYHLGVALMGLGRADEAAVALKRCLAVSPNMLPAYRRLVELYQGPLRDDSLARAYRREAHVLILQRRLRRRGSAPRPGRCNLPLHPNLAPRDHAAESLAQLARVLVRVQCEIAKDPGAMCEGACDRVVHEPDVGPAPPDQGVKDLGIGLAGSIAKDPAEDRAHDSIAQHQHARELPIVAIGNAAAEQRREHVTVAAKVLLVQQDDRLQVRLRQRHDPRLRRDAGKYPRQQRRDSVAGITQLDLVVLTPLVHVKPEPGPPACGLATLGHPVPCPQR